MRQRPDSELQAAVMHIAYELDQMVDAAVRITRAEDSPTQNALLESTLLHARALIELLLGTGKPNDIRAGDIAPGWPLPTGAARTALKQRKLAIDRHLSHLTWTRVDDGKAVWPYPHLVREVVDHLRGFVAAVSAAQEPWSLALTHSMGQVEWKSRRVLDDNPTSITTTGAFSETQRAPLRLPFPGTAS
jgi:hypothetical protein